MERTSSKPLDELRRVLDGAQLFRRALSAADISKLARELADLPADQPGFRLGAGKLPRLEKVHAIAAQAIGDAAKPVRAVLFNKTANANWSLGWHQDRTIVVEQRRAYPGFGPWSVKSGLQHVEPPFDIIQGMVTIRLHLDPVDSENAPLLVALGSHRCGKIPVSEVDRRVAQSETAACLAKTGDAWLYATSILHASTPAARPDSRRVLQIDYAAHDLPGGLRWLGV